MAICWMVFGVGFYSYTIGNMTQMISSFDSDNQEIQQKLDTLKKFQKTTKIPNRLFYRIKRHLENNQIQKKYHDSEELLSKLGNGEGERERERDFFFRDLLSEASWAGVIQ